MTAPETWNTKDLRDRFDLTDGQFFAFYTYKNLWWDLDGIFFGFGDLRSEDIFRIKFRLEPNEVFQGWNEHHGTQFQQSDTPMIRIQKDNIKMRIDLINEKMAD